MPRHRCMCACALTRKHRFHSTSVVLTQRCPLLHRISNFIYVVSKTLKCLKRTLYPPLHLSSLGGTIGHHTEHPNPGFLSLAGKHLPGLYNYIIKQPFGKLWFLASLQMSWTCIFTMPKRAQENLYLFEGPRGLHWPRCGECGGGGLHLTRRGLGGWHDRVVDGRHAHVCVQ